MNSKTCLLVTDDPDDHHAFSEALSEISSKTIVLIVLDSEKALELLQSGKHIPDYMCLDLSMHGIRINSFLKAMHTNKALSSIPALVYGDESGFERIDNPNGVRFFNKDYEYSELKKVLSEFTKPAT